ncbi:response regulator transcription factor [Kitasatospora sp. NPDC051853]|uniref:response regulator transcription factor n=1 Tax=Kitasatospora sp. NPDC051853 TaxID=3364058 RepID=UPI0037925CD8
MATRGCALPGRPVAGHPPVRVLTAGGTVGEAVLGSLRRVGVPAAAECDDAVLLAAAPTVDQALDGCPADGRTQGLRLLVVASGFTAVGVRRAVRAGAVAMLHSSDATGERLVDALHSAYHGDGRMPYDVLVRLLRHPGGEAAAPARPGTSPLTPRQATVLSLVAEGHDNAAIARALSCSQHTVKNALYELMSRLHARNRAHAVAEAVRTGLI